MFKLKQNYLTYISIILFLLIATIVIAHFGWDLKLQEKFYKLYAPKVWYQKNYPAWHFAYDYGGVPAITLSLISLIILILSWLKPYLKQFRKYCLLIVLTLILGPGLIINGILKDHRGRPRPRQVQEFGGRWEFHEVWQTGIPGKGKSFPCGHCSMGFLFITLYYSFKRKNKIVSYSFLGFSFAYGSFIGLARIAQGGHFLSDVIWAGGLTYLIAAILYYSILKIPDKDESELIAEKTFSIPQKPLKILLVTITLILSLFIIIFVFMFSKPVYKEYTHFINKKNNASYLNFNFNIERGDIIIQSGNYDNLIQINTKIQGFGYPKHKFKSQLDKQVENDTLKANYLLSTKGYFYELDVNVIVSIDTATFVIISGENSNGDIFMNKSLFETQIINAGLKTPKGQIKNIY